MVRRSPLQTRKTLQSPRNTSFERALLEEGKEFIAGIDEVGRGSLAGPVVAASCILPPDETFPGLNDSKLLTPEKREELFDLITKKALAWAIGSVDSLEIDSINILQASLKAMQLSVKALSLQPKALLIDGQYPIQTALPQQTIPFGDSLSPSIAAASILAKVTRDRWMCEYEKEYPLFRFSRHKGYGTERHLEEIKMHGPTPIHRMTFRGVVPR